MIRRFCIIGVGLIGGSAALRARGFCGEIVGVDADPANLDRAEALGVVDRGRVDPEQGVEGADFVLIATPVGTIEPLFRRLRPVWRPECVYTDAGSTKGSVVDAARRVFGKVPSNFIPGHPIAGAERSGVEAADASLFEGKRVILTPLPDSAPDALARVGEFWTYLGAKVERMEAERHDEVLAATSHLPHVLAFTLARMLGRKDEQAEIFRYAAGGFRDFTRIASSDPRMWLDICRANREPLLELLAEYEAALREVAGLIRNDDAGRLYACFSEARSAREKFLQLTENNHA
ncbi:MULTISPECIES: prephenate dehydrogenase [Methylococcus]|jgi:prephenate dehydrogenase|uniref:prephenate dehydrogenase n=1 Tax=Methylococcus capsulatus TaxID=414 RepID=A0AA35UXN8_METCP|nr:prephenate dehydrogenase/arogenate dehydrogenase family protein [Methylococcus capsulatus]QXP90761.1 prephenate dehydrogenase/arogenate dehydrogenase family protein [Methylococcus capsulatus]CAI8888124.1 prephenate dehydrogenase [Methylococcus capsulatus]